ncbi:MAG: CD1871A family CXXC motif-containing protein [Clostridiaceae bacterium]|nr:CD1871A family CXXC motif-containing protein [Clostridiaceae bacterium]
MKKLVRYLVLAVGIGMIALGVRQGDQADVLRKAIHICLECIGIG